MIRPTGILFILGVLLAYLPKWSRPDLFFGITVETTFAFTPQAKRILHRYWVEVALHTLIAWCVAGLVGIEKPWGPLPAIAWLLIGSSWATARAHRATAQYAAVPSPLREANLSAQPGKMPGGRLVAIGPLLFLAAADRGPLGAARRRPLGRPHATQRLRVSGSARYALWHACAAGVRHPALVANDLRYR